MSFEALLENLEELKKSQGVNDGDEKIAAAAVTADKKSDVKDDDEGKDGEGDDEVMGKSMTITLADGSTQDVLDATEMIKSLQSRVIGLAAERESEREHLGKSLTLVHDMLKEQGDVLKALGEQVVAMANAGRGRKSAVVTVQGEDMIKSQPVVTETPDELLNKCLAAQAAGRLSGMDVSIAETSLNRGLPIPEHIRTRLS